MKSTSESLSHSETSNGFLKQGVMEGSELAKAVEDMPEDEPQGTPQGGVISPLLANIYLDPLDWLMAGLGFEMVRYADDGVVLCRNQEEAGAALEKLREWMAGAVESITNAGPTATSRNAGSFACYTPGNRHLPVSVMEQTTDWSAGCGNRSEAEMANGKSARPVRRGKRG